MLTDGDGRARGESWLATVLHRRSPVVVIRPAAVTAGVSMATIEPMGGGFVEVYAAVDSATRGHEARARANLAALGDTMRRAGVGVSETTAPYAPSISNRRTRRNAARAVVRAAHDAGVGTIVIAAPLDFAAELDSLVAREPELCVVDGADSADDHEPTAFDEVADLWTDLGGES